MRTGIVIGHYDSLDFLELNLRAIRQHCGDVPVVVSDDCTEGLERTPKRTSKFHRLYDLAVAFPPTYVWPNVARLGHTGGDMAAFWKAIVWGHACQMQVVYKISQRFIIDLPNWHTEGACLLVESGKPLLGRDCTRHHWHVRTEACGLLVCAWHQPAILNHLTPRPVGWPTEQVLHDDLRDRLGGELYPWPIMSDARNKPAPGILFREANRPDEYASLAMRLGMVGGTFDCREQRAMQGYKM